MNIHMKIENVMIKRRQIVFSDREFTDINNAHCRLKSALQFAPNNELQRAADELENILGNIEIQDDGHYYVLSEKSSEG